MIEDIEDYFAKGCGRCERFATVDCSSQTWADALVELRRICLAAGLTECVKWGHPCYMHAGRNVVVFGAFREDVRLSFFYAELLSDDAGVLEPAGPNSAASDVWRFRASAEVIEQESLIARYLLEAMRYAEEGVVPKKRSQALDLPVELEEAFAADTALADAFATLTPGRKRSYAIFVGGAKKPATRSARVLKSRNKIFAGKGANER